MVMNAAACMVIAYGKYEHITPLFHNVLAALAAGISANTV